MRAAICFFVAVAACGLEAFSKQLSDINDLEYSIEELKQWMITPEETINDILNSNQEADAARVDAKYVGFYYSSRQTTTPVKLLTGEAAQLKKTDFDPKRKTSFVIHGWNNDKGSQINTDIKKAILSKEDRNVFVVDWGKYTKFTLYTTAKNAAPGVADVLYSFIVELGQQMSLDVGLVEMAGHSLGAHVAGFCGKRLEGKMAAIVGMDPAMPFYIFNQTENRLHYTDAKYVEVIHTCSGFLGFDRPIGQVDFYPNGDSTTQPGCGADLIGICAHGRAYMYYAESVASGNFLGTSCDNYDDYLDGNCDDNTKIMMGGLDYTKKAPGVYFLKTSTQSPFALGG